MKLRSICNGGRIAFPRNITSFIDRMVDHLAPVEATPKQREYLQNLLIKLAQ
jgi:hypothetical protein